MVGLYKALTKKEERRKQTAKRREMYEVLRHLLSNNIP